MTPSWLPPLVYASDHGNHWEAYVRALYRIFTTDFIESGPDFDGQTVNLVKVPLDQGKHVTFWHIISEGKTEDDRLPAFGRCERIRWPRPIIEHSQEEIVKVWENKRRGQTRVCIWLEAQSYLVVLIRRSTFFLLLTAYPTDEKHTQRKLRKEHADYLKANAAP